MRPMTPPPHTHLPDSWWPATVTCSPSLLSLVPLQGGCGAWIDSTSRYITPSFVLPPAISLPPHCLPLHTPSQEALPLLTSQQVGRVQWFPWQHKLVVLSALQSGHLGAGPSQSPGAGLVCHYVRSFAAHMSSSEDAQLLISALVGTTRVPAALALVVGGGMAERENSQSGFECPFVSLSVPFSPSPSPSAPLLLSLALSASLQREYEGLETLHEELFTHFLNLCFDSECLPRVLSRQPRATPPPPPPPSSSPQPSSFTCS